MVQLEPPPAALPVDWEQIRITLRRQSEPTWVPFLEAGIHLVHKQRILRRPLRTLSDTLEVAERLGQPFVVGLGVRTVHVYLDTMRSTHIEAEENRSWKVGSTEGDQRRWAETGVGVIGDEADLEAFPWPDAAEIDLGVLNEAKRLLPGTYKVIVAIGKVFNLAWWLMGFEAYADALFERPASVEQLHARIADVNGAVLWRALDYECAGLVWHADDMAYRTGLLVSPQVLRRHVSPVYERFNTMCRQRDVLTVFHSDGNIDGLIDDVIKSGFDALNPLEPVAMDIREVERRVDGRLGPIGNVRLAHTLTRGTPEEVRSEVRELIRDLGPGGGYALASANSIPEYVPWENLVAIDSAWLAYGRYPIEVQSAEGPV